MSKINWRLVRRLVPASEVRTFLLFLLLACVIWTMYTIGTQRDVELEAPVVYYGVPDDVRMTHEMPKSVTFTVSDLGSQMWKYVFLDADTIEIDLTSQFAEGKKNVVHIYYTEYIEAMLSTISQTCKILSIDPSDYESGYEKVYTRRVPVVLSNLPTLNPEFTFSGPVTIEPSEICIRGSREIVGGVESVRVDTLRGVVKTSGTRTARLVGIRGVELLQNEVKVHMNVERMTEKSFSFPVEVRNMPDKTNIRVFPKNVTVVFNVGLSRYKTLSSEKMSVVFDCDSLIEGEPTNRLILESAEPLDGIVYKIEPEVVEYIKEVN